MKGPVLPHGGKLVDRVVPEGERAELLVRVAGLPQVELPEWAAADLELLATGVYSPLDGFMDMDTYRSVVREMHLPGGLPWTLPITLPVPVAEAGRLRPGQEVALVAGGQVLGLLQLTEVFSADREDEAHRVFGTADPAHPGVARLLGGGGACLAGPVRLLRRRRFPYPDLLLDPADTRAAFAARGWRRVVGFQTRNPVHRAHEYIQKVALETVDGLFLSPLLGETKADDIPGPVRVAAYRTLLEGYYPPDRVLLSAFPAAMRYAGPREAVFHAICRKNYGCSHFIVGRDHAGVGHYYGTYDAQRIFDQFDPAALGVVPLCFEHTFFCRRCAGMASAKTCPHGPDHHISLSGTRVREMLRAGELPPPEFSRPEVARVLAQALQDPARPLAGD